MLRSLPAFWADDAGATAIEYSLIASLIFLAIIGAVSLFASNASLMWTSVAGHLNAS